MDLLAIGKEGIRGDLWHSNAKSETSSMNWKQERGGGGEWVGVHHWWG